MTAALRVRAARLGRGAGVFVALSLLSIWTWRGLFLSGIGHQIPATYLTPGDVGQGVLFLSWLPFAIGHHVNPFFSPMMYAPHGVNMLSNTSFFLTSLVVSPITAIFGPVAAFDVAVIAAPAVSGGALYWVLRRYSVGGLAAFVGALFYGYSPYLLTEAQYGHFNLSWMFFPPLLVYLLDEIFVRQQMPVWKSGGVLALLGVLEFFNSLEMMVATGFLAAIVLAVLGLAHPRAAWARLPRALAALGVAGGIAAIALAYPIWFYFSGPQHVTTFNQQVSTIADAVTSPWWPSATALFIMPKYLIDRIDSGFVGPVVCLVIVASALLWRRARLAVPMLIGVVVSYVLSLGPYFRIGSTGLTRAKAPDYWLLNVGVVRNLQPYRFAGLTDLCAAVLIGLSLDWCIGALRERRLGRNLVVRTGLVGLLAAVILAFPLFGWFRHHLVENVVSPRAVTSGPLARAPVGSTALILPAAFINRPEPMVWQAMSGIRYDTTSGYAWRPLNAAADGVAYETSSPLNDLFGPNFFGAVPPFPRRVSARTLYAVRANLIAWKVDIVVFQAGYPDPSGRGRRLMEAILGRRAPVHIGGAIVWGNVYRTLSGHRPHYRAITFPPIVPSGPAKT